MLAVFCCGTTFFYIVKVCPSDWFNREAKCPMTREAFQTERMLGRRRPSCQLDVEEAGKIQYLDGVNESWGKS